MRSRTSTFGESVDGQAESLRAPTAPGRGFANAVPEPPRGAAGRTGRLTRFAASLLLFTRRESSSTPVGRQIGDENRAAPREAVLGPETSGDQLKLLSDAIPQPTSAPSSATSYRRPSPHAPLLPDRDRRARIARSAWNLPPALIGPQIHRISEGGRKRQDGGGATGAAGRRGASAGRSPEYQVALIHRLVKTAKRAANAVAICSCADRFAKGGLGGGDATTLDS
ncbi:hypothetical protein SKAU_G00290050 [Synaphobranchus kaupii]|uniref:Uncharacterized protein n=1 Tax=Synaphobranchus kaupii TaxID=118154 RepID=A0A9Q1ETI9_SYNKA|nr:hypothetical protein SKAU_G00290050 [Synaphobranchus kaupii]